MPERYAVRLPGGATVVRVVRDGATDEEVRAAFAGTAKSHGWDVNQQQVVRPENKSRTLGDILSSSLGRPQGEIKAKKPTLGDLLQEKIRGGLEALGAKPDYARHLGGKVTNALTDFTPVGDVASAGDARTAWDQGRYGAAVGNALAALVGSVPGVGDALAGAGKAASHAIIAPLFHGSPHKFDKFSLEHIGKGEGAQAYGRGLYFAENPAVARDYRNTLAVPRIHGREMRMNETDAWGALSSANGDVAAALARAESELAQRRAAGGSIYDIEPFEDRVGTLRAWQKFGVPQITDTGHLYKVRLNADPQDFADFDSLGPVAEQHARESGLAGVRYLDGLSRKAGQGSNNYVVFDDSIIDILSRQ